MTLLCTEQLEYILVYISKHVDFALEILYFFHINLLQ